MPAVGEPPSTSPQAWSQDEAVVPGFEFDSPVRSGVPPGSHPRRPGARPSARRGAGPGARRAARPGARLGPGPADRPADRPGARPGARPGPHPLRPDAGEARGEWSRLLRSFLPAPAKRNWFAEFRSALRFRGVWPRVIAPIVAMMVFGVAVVVIANANHDGGAGSTPPSASLGFPPATLAGNEFTAADSGRGISQTLGRVASDGAEIVAVGSQQGARIARAQFYVSMNDGRSWSMGTVRAAGGGPPPPGHAARFVAGGNGAWLAIGPESIWTSTDGRTWTLASTAGLPLGPGDQISVLKRTASGFIAVGSNVPGGNAADASPVVFLSANGISWQRLDAAALNLATGGDRVLDIRYAAVLGNRIMIAGDVASTQSTAVTSAAWLSVDGGSTWTLAVPPGAAPAGHGASDAITGLAAVADGFILARPATTARQPAGRGKNATAGRGKNAAASSEPAVDVYRSPNGLSWTFAAALTTPAGFAADMTDGAQDGAVIAGQAGQNLIAFTSASGASWRRTPAFGRTTAQDPTGVAVAAGGTVVTAGTTTSDPDSRQPLLTVLGTKATPVDIANIPGASDPQLAVNAIASGSGLLVAVGSANGFPAAWASAGGGTWTRAVGRPTAALERPGVQQLTSVTYGPAGWLAVGGVVAVAAEHPVVIGSADGHVWTAADNEAAFSQPGLVTDAAAAAQGGYVIVGSQAVAGRTVAAAWWSAGVTGWHRASAPSTQSTQSTRMLAVAADPRGFVAVGAAGNAAAAWTSTDGGRTWTQATVPLPVGAAKAVLQHVRSNGSTVVAVGTALTTDGQQLPFAAASADGGTTWTESALPVPQGSADVTALTGTGAGGEFVATGTFGLTQGHRDVVVWTSANGTIWRAVTPRGQGLTGPGIQAITALTASGVTLTGVGFSADPAGEQPVFWQSPIR
jgi:hypothetical protein